MGKELVALDWPSLTEKEVRAVLRRCQPLDVAWKNSEIDVVWYSPRPMSAASLVRVGDSSVFVKRHHRAVRTPDQLGVEHAFANHLRRRGLTVPRVLRSLDGTTVVEDGEFVYEVHETASGIDLYRDVLSWAPFMSLGHARSAGRTLATFHEASRDFPLPSRPQGVLMSSTAIVAAREPLAALGRLLDARPRLARAVASRRLIDDFTRHHLVAIQRVAPFLTRLAPQWGHGDWHPSNLTWSSTTPQAAVVGVFDLSLANRTFAVHDLAIALERTAIDWLDLADQGRVDADLAAVDALLDGYCEVRPLDEVETAALTELLPVVHLEYALSEVEYFAAIVRSEANANLAYDGYFLGHARWFEGDAGSALLTHLRGRAECSKVRHEDGLRA